MAYFDPFWPIFDPVTYIFYVFVCKMTRKPNFDHQEGLKLYFYPQIGQNGSRYTILRPFVVILAIFEHKMVNLRVKI